MKSTDLAEVRKALWAAADQMRANSSLGPAEYRGPVLGLIFLAYAEHRFDLVTPELEEKASKYNPVTPDHYKARSVLYVPDEARLSNLVTLPEGENRGKAVDEAMKAIEAANPELKDVLPRGYQRMEQSVLIELCRLFAPLPRQLSGDAFGLIYEDFLSNFAMAEGRLGGEFFTPYSIVRLIVEIIEPFQGRVFDPACGSGGMFVQCAKFVERHNDSPTEELSVYGQEQKEVTVPLAKMNLALHGLSGDIRLGNTYYDDLHKSVGKFDFVMANPPFNVDGVDKDKLAGDKRFPFGIPNPDNGNYLWIQAFYSALNDEGPGRVRHGQLGRRRRTLREGDPPPAHRVGRRRRHGRHRHQLLLHRDPARHALVPRQGQGRHRAGRHGAVHRRPPPSTARSTGPTATSCPSRSSSSPTSPASTEARTSRRSTAATPCSRSTSPTAPTSTCPACARSPPEPRSKRRAGASTPAATPERPWSRRTTRTSPRSSPASTTSSPG